jgi:hypothetical protein
VEYRMTGAGEKWRSERLHFIGAKFQFGMIKKVLPKVQ